MTMHVLSAAPPPDLAHALAEFERQFTYPLGQGRSFSISHGDDYGRFFRAMGDAGSFIIEQNARVLGTLGVAVRRLQLPDGGSETIAYFGDLKVDAAGRKGFVFLQLAIAAENWLRGKASRGFGVVMDGTAATPDKYTGFLGFPAARVLGKTIVWQFPCSEVPLDTSESFVVEPKQVVECFRRLSQGRYACPEANPAERSQMTPIALLHPDGLACGLVEDTRRCKRLLADDGAELRSAHLSFFAWKSPVAAASLVKAALQVAVQASHPALFVAVAPSDVKTLEAALRGRQKIVAPATIYGSGLDEKVAWNINTAEI